MRLPFSVLLAASALTAPASAALVFEQTGVIGKETITWTRDADFANSGPRFRLLVRASEPITIGSRIEYGFVKRIYDEDGRTSGISSDTWEDSNEVIAAAVSRQFMGYRSYFDVEYYESGAIYKEYREWSGLESFWISSYWGGATYTVSLFEGASYVPEPATWAMMIAGFGLVGMQMRRRSFQRSQNNQSC